MALSTSSREEWKLVGLESSKIETPENGEEWS